MSDTPSLTPPWLAKLNAQHAQAESAISHTPLETTPSPVQQSNSPTQIEPPIEIEFKTESGSVTTNSPELKSAINVLVSEDIPPGHYNAVIQEDPASGNNVVKPVGVAIQFDAAAFAQAIGGGSRAEASAESPVDKVELNQSFGKLGCDARELYSQPCNWSGLGTHGSVELDADAAKLEAMVGAGADGPTLEDVGLDQEYKEHLLSNPASQFQQEYPLEDGPGEEDGPWAPGWAERSGDVSTPHFKVDPLLSDAEIPCMSSDWKPPVHVELPEVVDVESKPLVQPASSVVDYVSADKDQPVVSEEEYYAAIVAQLRPSNPTEASLIERLRLFQSQYVGLITTPEQAIDHIAQCRRDNNPIGGSEAVELSAQSTSLKHKQYIERRYAPHKLKREAVEAARKGWKDAIAQKEAAMKQWEAFVKWHHDNYAQMKKMPVESFQSQQGGESDAQSD